MRKSCMKRSNTQHPRMNAVKAWTIPSLIDLLIQYWESSNGSYLIKTTTLQIHKSKCFHTETECQYGVCLLLLRDLPDHLCKTNSFKMSGFFSHEALLLVIELKNDEETDPIKACRKMTFKTLRVCLQMSPLTGYMTESLNDQNSVEIAF